eukprot:COSAG01_NODE_3213_length_6410_cov_2.970211_6_plen_74_part_00
MDGFLDVARETYSTVVNDIYAYCSQLKDECANPWAWVFLFRGVTLADVEHVVLHCGADDMPSLKLLFVRLMAA